MLIDIWTEKVITFRRMIGGERVWPIRYRL